MVSKYDSLGQTFDMEDDSIGFLPVFSTVLKKNSVLSLRNPDVTREVMVFV